MGMAQIFLPTLPAHDSLHGTFAMASTSSAIAAPAIAIVRIAVIALTTKSGNWFSFQLLMVSVPVLIVY